MRDIHLKAAADAAADNDLERVLDALLEAWRDTRADRLAELIDKVSAALTRSRPPVTTAGAENLTEAFRARAAEGLAADVGPLLKFVADRCKQTPKLFALAAELAETRPADPRIAKALVGYFKKPPYRDKKGAGTMKRMFAALEAIDDPRSRALIIEQSAKYRGKTKVHPALGRQGMPRLHACADTLAARPPAPELDNEASAICDAISKAIGSASHKARTKAKRPSIEALWRAVYEEPGDLARHLVLADALQEAGDPRGELITLQCARAAKEVQTGRPKRRAKRETELLKAHERQWLGKVEPVVMRQGLSYARGFLVGCALAADSYRHVGHQIWATVEELDVQNGGSWEFLTHPVMGQLRTLRGLKMSGLRQIVTHEGAPLGWTRLVGGRAFHDWEQDRPRLGELKPIERLSTVLPALEELDLQGPGYLVDARDLAALFSGLGPSMRRLRLALDHHLGEGLPELVADALSRSRKHGGLQELSLSSVPAWTLVFESRGAGELTTLRAVGVVDRRTQGFALHRLEAVLSALDQGALDTLRVEFPKKHLSWVEKSIGPIPVDALESMARARFDLARFEVKGV